ncbi:MAG: hypothetical protein A2V74_04515 [Acidobacteria bacterium RBG_16_70_10]|nr:MAG: hypothetical protein A2V74_04515 [Acidobacteria bacterium RBG_16_70_10]
MRRGALVLGAVLLVATARGGEEKEKPEPAPRIKVAPASWDFGRAFPNQRLRKQFTLRNVGDRELVIEKVSTTCGCTVAEGYDRTITPGGSTPLVVSLETRQSLGRIEKRVAVRSNDPETPMLEIAVAATVVPPTPKIGDRGAARDSRRAEAGAPERGP